MTKDEMVTEIIRKYGFEDEWTIWFCELYEILTDDQLERVFLLLK